MAAQGDVDGTAMVPRWVIPPPDMPTSSGEDPYAEMWVKRARAWGEAGKAWLLCALLVCGGGVLLLIIGPTDPRAPAAPPGQEVLEGTVRARFGDPQSGPVTYRVADQSNTEREIVTDQSWDAGDPVWLFVRQDEAVSISERTMPRDLVLAGGAVLVIIAAFLGALATWMRLRQWLRRNPYPAD